VRRGTDPEIASRTIGGRQRLLIRAGLRHDPISSIVQWPLARGRPTGRDPSAFLKTDFIGRFSAETDCIGLHACRSIWAPTGPRRPREGWPSRACTPSFVSD
jgi:hypothetical protein